MRAPSMNEPSSASQGTGCAAWPGHATPTQIARDAPVRRTVESIVVSSWNVQVAYESGGPFAAGR
jgi:hypothetical protein